MNVKQVVGYQSEISKLTQRRHLSFMGRTVGRVNKYLLSGDAAPCPENLKSRALAFTKAYDQEKESFKNSRASDYTAQIRTADQARDNTLAGFHAMFDALSRIGSEEQKSAVARIQKTFDLYKIKATESYEDQGIKLAQLCDEFDESSALQADLQTCLLTPQMALLRQQNEECCQLVDARNEERSQIDHQAMLRARKETDQVYADFIFLLNAYAAVTSNDGRSPYDDLIDVLNTDIDYYKSWVLRKNNGTEDDHSTDLEQSPCNLQKTDSDFVSPNSGEDE